MVTLSDLVRTVGERRFELPTSCTQSRNATAAPLPGQFDATGTRRQDGVARNSECCAGQSGRGMTTTGTGECCSTVRLTEPSSRAAKPPWPRVPTTSMSASLAASMRALAGLASLMIE